MPPCSGYRSMHGWVCVEILKSQQQKPLEMQSVQRRHSVSLFSPYSPAALSSGGHTGTQSSMEAMYKEQVQRLTLENKRLQVRFRGADCGGRCDFCCFVLHLCPTPAQVRSLG